jgi:Fur family ferric uptake transcriptional regulator
MPRRAISRVIANSTHEFLTASMILEQIEEQFGHIDPSTVYRTLDELEKLGLIHHVHLGAGQAGMWHLTVDQDHQHLVCENCGKTVDVPANEIELTYALLRKKYGFTPNTHHFTILGYCEDCGPEHSDA